MKTYIAFAAVTITLALAALAMTPAYAAAPPLSRARTSNGFALNSYENAFYWFGFDLFGTNIAYGNWSNCPVYNGAVPAAASNPRCLAQTANGNTAYQNSGWDSNAPDSSPFNNFYFVTPTVMETSLSISSYEGVTTAGNITFVLASVNATGYSFWFANPLAAHNVVQLYDLTGSSIGFVREGGYLVFKGTPGPTSFVSGVINEWSYRYTTAPTTVGTTTYQYVNAVYVQSQHAYLALTGVHYLSASVLSESQLAQIINTTPYLGTSPAP